MAWSSLTIQRDGAGELVFAAKHHVPSWWPVLFPAGTSFRATASTRLAEARPRLAGLARATSHADRPMLHGLREVVALLERQPAESVVTLDADQVARQHDDDRVADALARRCSALHDRGDAFAALAEDWPSLLGGTPARDAIRLRRRFETPRIAEAYLRAGWGVAQDDAAEALAPWIDGLPTEAPLAAIEHEATKLHDALVDQQLIQPSEHPWVLRYLAIAARDRSPETLLEMLEVMYAQSMIEMPEARRLRTARWKVLDRVVASNGAPRSVPAFDRLRVVRALERLGD